MEVEQSMLAEETPAKGRQTGGGAAPTASSGVQCFDCNICLQPVAEPVVTLCGHLYCWPCVYRWLRSDRPGANQCPVCKAAVSEDGLVPLYGRGITTDAAKCNGGIQIPSRPPAVSVEHRSRPPQDDGYDLYWDFQPLPRYRHQEHLGYYYYNNSGTGYRSWPTVFQSNAGCLISSAAVAVLPWAFRGGQTPLLTATALRYDDWRWTPRQRQVERWLHQMWLWIVLFVVLCFLLF